MDTNWPQLRKLNWFGLWPGSGWRGRLDSLMSYLIALSSTCLFVGEGYTAYQGILLGDFLLTMQASNEATSGILFFFYVLCFIFNKQRISETFMLIDDLNEKVVKEVGAAGEAEIRRRKTIGWRAYTAYLGAFFLVVTAFTVSPVLSTVLGGEYVPILHAWMPLDNKILLSFLGQMTFQVICCYNYTMAKTMFGSIFVSICELIFGHLKVLRHCLENIEYGSPQGLKELKRCIKHHNRILKIIEMFQGVTSLTLIADCVFTMLTLCIILIELTNEGSSHERGLGVIAEAQLILMSLGTFCWYGNEITFQVGILRYTCSEVLTSCYNGRWYEGSREEKQLLLTIMRRTMKPVHLGAFVRLDIVTFINILKGAFSYYNVLTAEHKGSTKL